MIAIVGLEAQHITNVKGQPQSFKANYSTENSNIILFGAEHTGTFLFKFRFLGNNGYSASADNCSYSKVHKNFVSLLSFDPSDFGNSLTANGNLLLN